MNEVFHSFTQSLVTETGIDTASAEKVINWLVAEGVLDMPVVTDIHAEPTTEGNKD